MFINSGGYNMNGREQILTMLDLMGENEIERVLQLIKDTFKLKAKTWDDIEEDDPMPDEIEAIEEYLASKS
jgi:hypothetical protein